MNKDSTFVRFMTGKLRFVLKFFSINWSTIWTDFIWPGFVCTVPEIWLW
jgi:hypothetical protein